MGVRARLPRAPPAVSWFSKHVFDPTVRAVSAIRPGTLLVGAAKVGTVLEAIKAHPELVAALPGKIGAGVLVAGTVYQTVAKPLIRAGLDAFGTPDAEPVSGGAAVQAAMVPVMAPAAASVTAPLVVAVPTGLPSVADAPHLVAADLTP